MLSMSFNVAPNIESTVINKGNIAAIYNCNNIIYTISKYFKMMSWDGIKYHHESAFEVCDQKTINHCNSVRYVMFKVFKVVYLLRPRRSPLNLKINSCIIE